MINKPLRKEQLLPPRFNANGGVVLTTAELRAAISSTKNGAIFSYEREVPVYLRKVAQSAEAIGKITCSKGAECVLTCTGISLLDCITPASLADGDLTARCTDTTCTEQPQESEGMRAATAYMQVEASGSPG